MAEAALALDLLCDKVVETTIHASEATEDRLDIDVKQVSQEIAEEVAAESGDDPVQGNSTGLDIMSQDLGMASQLTGASEACGCVFCSYINFFSCLILQSRKCYWRMSSAASSKT